VDEAAKRIDEAGLNYVLDGAGSYVRAQLPAAGAEMSEGALMMLYVDGSAEMAGAQARVPDVTGLSVLEANKLIRSFGLELRIEGSGLAVSQRPAADETVAPSTVVTVQFEPP